MGAAPQSIHLPFARGQTIENSDKMLLLHLINPSNGHAGSPLI